MTQILSSNVTDHSDLYLLMKPSHKVGCNHRLPSSLHRSAPSAGGQRELVGLSSTLAPPPPTQPPLNLWIGDERRVGEAEAGRLRGRAASDQT